MSTKVFAEEFKGNKMFAVYDVDENGEQQGQYAVVKFGLRKAKAILEHFEDLKAFVKENKK